VSVVTPVRRAFDYWIVQYRHWWRVSLLITFVTPALYIAAMGVGLGGLVDRGGHTRTLGGHDYLSFLAPGLLAATAMQTAIGESLWPVGNAVRWSRSYLAMVATPLRPREVMVGHLCFVGLRVGLVTSTFMLVATAFGALSSPLAVLAWPAAVLCGVASAAAAMAFSVGRRHDHAYAALHRFVVVPMFLFSGVFFPVTALPVVLREVAYLTPLWHGVALCRDLTLGQAGLVAEVGHAGYLLVWTVVGTLVGDREYVRTLTR